MAERKGPGSWIHWSPPELPSCLAWVPDDQRWRVKGKKGRLHFTYNRTRTLCNHRVETVIPAHQLAEELRHRDRCERCDDIYRH